MQTTAELTEDRLFRGGATLLGATLTAAAALSADFARMHMLTLGTVCGADPHPHCGWCFGAASLGLAGLAAFYVAFKQGNRASTNRRTGLLQIKAVARRP
ncbi:MAG: hypothetical protein U1C74_17360 [Phenylobacterium sp.]|nr:hypothetical protein [Phenylobacterium sp.]